MEFGKALKGTLTLVSGRTAKQMAMEFIIGRMEIGMRDNGKLV